MVNSLRWYFYPQALPTFSGALYQAIIFIITWQTLRFVGRGELAVVSVDAAGDQSDTETSTDCDRKTTHKEPFQFSHTTSPE